MIIKKKLFYAYPFSHRTNNLPKKKGIKNPQSLIPYNIFLTNSKLIV
jgi:hypothetical protein